MEKWALKLRIFLWIILAGVVGWLLYMAVAPTGEISYVYDFREPSYFINKLTPEERVKPIVCDKEIGSPAGDAISCSQFIIGDPVYFSLRTPRRFGKAALTMKYKTVGTRRGASLLPIIEAGVLVDKTIWRYDLKPIENKIIDQLSLVWDEVREGNAVLLQRDVSTSTESINKFNSIQDFLDNLFASPKLGGPALNEIALYNYPLRQSLSEASDLKTDFILEDYEPEDATKLSFNVNYPLRGAYQFYTYIKDEDLDFVFNFQDLNKNKDSDEIDLHLYYNNQLIDSRHLDDETSEDNGELINRGEIKLKLTSLPEGVYKIELRANDDIITKSVKTKQQKLAFINKLWLVDDNNSQIILYTDSMEIKAQTVNPGSLQTIKAGDSELAIDETYKQFSVEIDKELGSEASELSSIVLEKDDIILAGDGVFSFGRENLINPEVKKVDANMDIDREGINYILANYNYPREEGEWKIAKAEIDLSGAYREDGKYSFLISIPGLRADDDINDYIEIGEIKIDLTGKSLFEKLGFVK